MSPRAALLSPSSRLVAAVLVAMIVVVSLTTPRPPTPTLVPGGASSVVTPTSAAVANGTPDGATETPAGSAAEPGIPTPGATVLATAVPPRPTPRPTVKPAACTPTDQDLYVYNPDRLAVQKACIHVTGVVQAVRKEADGDLHILLHLDSQYADLVTPANQGEELGDLVVEPVCVRSVTQVDAEAVCASDPDPLQAPFPTVGERVWMEGRYVFDLDHVGWAELHPLFRWGP